VDRPRHKVRLLGRRRRASPLGTLLTLIHAQTVSSRTTLIDSTLNSKNMARYARRPASGFRPRGPWKNGVVPVIGLIGGIGAGKSVVAKALAERGAHVLDADAIGHALLDQKPARDQVVQRFGAGILIPEVPDGSPARIDRKALGAIVFAQPKALKDLEAILHPRMRGTFAKAIARDARNRSVPLVVIDAAVLLEAGWDDLCDKVVFVDATRDQRLARLSTQRGWTADDLDARERAQKPLAEKRRQAHHVLTNDADPAALQEAVSRLWPALVKPPRRLPASASSKPRNPGTMPRSARE
jgi:dephospho-CoA kinase